jgi:IS30 family transposase
MTGKQYRRLSLEDRCQISVALKMNLSQTQIGELLGVHKSTISRELKRNALWGGLRYQSHQAQDMAIKRRRHCHRPYVINQELEGVVVHSLFEGWSPEQIAGRLRLEGARGVCAQSIYNYIYQRETLLRPLLRRAYKRGAGRLRYRKRLKNDGRVYIDERPQGAQNRSRFGHWERDTFSGKDLKKLLAMVERKSRLLKIRKLKNGKAKNITKETLKLLEESLLPAKSLTNDNATEFEGGKDMDMDVYYCHPMKPQQRGSIENAIGRLRKYIKNSTDLDELSENDIQDIENKYNFTPRKCLNFRSPYEIAYGIKVALVF